MPCCMHTNVNGCKSQKEFRKRRTNGLFLPKVIFVYAVNCYNGFVIVIVVVVHRG